MPETAAFPNTDRVGFQRGDDDYSAHLAFDASLLRRVLDVIIKAGRERDGYSKAVPTIVTLAIAKANPGTSTFHLRAERPAEGWIAEALVMPCRT